MKIIHSIMIVAIACLAFEAKAGGTSVSGGGDALVCYDLSERGFELKKRVVEILQENKKLGMNGISPFEMPNAPELFTEIKKVLSFDIYLYFRPTLDEKGNQAPLELDSSKKIEDLFNEVTSRYDRLSNMGDLMKASFQEVPLTHWRAAAGVTEIDDAEHELMIPSNCVLVQLAVMRDGMVNYDAKLYSRMETLDRVGLHLHEHAYRLARKYSGAQNSNIIPFIIGPFLVKELSDEEIDLWWKRVDPVFYWEKRDNYEGLENRPSLRYQLQFRQKIGSDLLQFQRNYLGQQLGSVAPGNFDSITLYNGRRIQVTSIVVEEGKFRSVWTKPSEKLDVGGVLMSDDSGLEIEFFKDGNNIPHSFRSRVWNKILVEGTSLYFDIVTFYKPENLNDDLKINCLKAPAVHDLQVNGQRLIADWVCLNPAGEIDDVRWLRASAFGGEKDIKTSFAIQGTIISANEFDREYLSNLILKMTKDKNGNLILDPHRNQWSPESEALYKKMDDLHKTMEIYSMNGELVVFGTLIMKSRAIQLASAAGVLNEGEADYIYAGYPSVFPTKWKMGGSELSFLRNSRMVFYPNGSIRSGALTQKNIFNLENGSVQIEADPFHKDSGYLAYDFYETGYPKAILVARESKWNGQKIKRGSTVRVTDQGLISSVEKP